MSPQEIDEFITNGFVSLRAAFPRSVVADCVRLMWEKIEARPGAFKTWTRPVIRHPAWHEVPLEHAINTPRLHAAFDQLVGRGRRRPRRHPGLFVIRF